MFGIAIGVLATHAMAALGGGTVGAWFHGAWVKARAEEATLAARVAALEAAAAADIKKVL